MKTKSADQIQAEIELMRLAYQDKLREAQPTRPHPLEVAVPWLIVTAVAAIITTVLVGIFL